MNESEAIKKVCPILSNETPKKTVKQKYANCIGSECMMWTPLGPWEGDIQGFCSFTSPKATR